jgi:ribosomal protein L31E
MERNYIIPLRKECQKVPKYSKGRKAVKATRKFLQKHMKVENVKLGKYLNLKLWENGNQQKEAKKAPKQATPKPKGPKPARQKEAIKTLKENTVQRDNKK